MKKPGFKIVAFLLIMASFLLVLFTGCELYTTNLSEKDTKKTSTGDKNSQFTGTGVINKIIEEEGTWNEYSYYILNYWSDETLLFNKDTNDSNGFDEYVDRKVKIIGKETYGVIGGWQKKIIEPGILVEKITIIK